MGQRPSKLEHLRAQRGMTQSALAVKAGVARETVRRIESGTVGCRLTTLYRIARALDVPVEELLEGAA